MNVFSAVSDSSSVPFARCASDNPSHIHHCLDAGAHGIIVPLVESAEQAHRIVASSTYPINGGERSYGPVRCSASWKGGIYFQEVDSLLVRLAMIETKKGLENVEAIAATPGISGLFVGPNDLSMSLGFAPSSSPSEPKVLDALDRILKAAQTHNKFVGLFCGDGKTAHEFSQKGFKFVIVGTDLGHVKQRSMHELDIAKRG